MGQPATSRRGTRSPTPWIIDLIEEDDALVEFKTLKATPPLDALPDNLRLTAYGYAYEILIGGPKVDRVVNLVKDQAPEDRGAGPLARRRGLRAALQRRERSASRHRLGGH
jgi:hypothetical protein